MPDDPFAKLGALDQQLFQSTPSPAVPEPAQPQQPKAKRATPAPKPLKPINTLPREQSTTRVVGNSVNHARMQECMHAIMKDIMQSLEDLQTPVKEPLSVRVTAEDVEWVQDKSFEWGREFKDKFSQGLIIRIGLKLLKKALQDDPEAVDELLQEVK